MSDASAQFNLVDYFLSETRLSKLGHRTAIEFRDRSISYSELDEQTERWAQRFVQTGLKEGERVALLLYDSPEFISSFFGALSVRAICVPINTFLPRRDVAFILADAGARMLILESDIDDTFGLTANVGNHLQVFKVDSETRTVINESNGEYVRKPAATTLDSPAFLLYTSGSTGSPKGVLHNNGSIPFTVESYAKSVLNLTTDDRVFSSSRMFFAYGLGNSLSFPFAAGATVLLEPTRMNAERLARFIEDRKPTVFFGVPAVYLSLLDYRSSGGQVDFSSVRLCVSAGEALPAKIVEDWQREFELTILDGIGSTEMLHIFISNREGKSRAGSSGTVVDGYDVRLSDEAREEVDANQLGNLWVRGGSAMAGYWNRTDLTEGTIVGGWVRTGDFYRRDDDGFFYHIGRSDDCFKVHGLWVSPIEVESVLVSHEAVSEAAIVCATDERGLATARAYVVIRQGERANRLQGPLEDELRRFVGSRLPPHKVPTHIQFIEEMPRTSTGKIQRYKLRARAG